MVTDSQECVPRSSGPRRLRVPKLCKSSVNYKNLITTQKRKHRKETDQSEEGLESILVPIIFGIIFVVGFMKGFTKLSLMLAMCRARFTSDFEILTYI